MMQNSAIGEWERELYIERLPEEAPAEPVVVPEPEREPAHV